MAPTSRAEATTPSSPAFFARRASATARDCGDPTIPTRRSAGASKLVKIVTPRSAGRRFPLPTASRAARIMAISPEVCTVRNRTFGSRAAAATAPATVFGISWNLRSRKMPNPRAASFSTARGPSAVKSWLPTLKQPATPRSCRAKAQAGPRRSTSRATISCDEPRRDVRAPQEAPGGPLLRRAGQSQVSAQLHRRHRVRGPRHRDRGR